MTDQTHWRLAVMFDAPDKDAAAFERAVWGIAGAVGRAARGAAVRLGVADRQLDLSGNSEIEDTVSLWRRVDAAIEISVPNARAAELPAVAKALRSPLTDVAAPGGIEVMAGPIHAIVPAQSGDTFLSLAFRRAPRRKAREFSEWWIHRHAVMAVPILGSELLAYDQVHVDRDVSRRLADSLGVYSEDYDAYDNLTWRDLSAFFSSCGGKVEEMGRLAEDEADWIEDGSRRQQIMRVVAAE